MKIFSFFLITAFFACAVSTYASEEASDQEISLGKIFVTNRRASSGLDEATENLSVVTAEQIKKLPVKDFNEALGYIPGVDIVPGRGFGRGTSVTIQGSDSRQVRVMIDGIPFNNQASGQVDLARFPLENIDRIEVIKGPSSSMWGSALGGVINIITKDTGTTVLPHGEATSSFAGFHTIKQSAEVSGKAGPFGYFSSLSHRESGGGVPRGDTLDTNAFGKVSYLLNPTDKVVGSFGYSGAEVNSGRYPDDSWVSQPYRARFGKLGWERDTGDVAINAELKTAAQDIVFKQFLTVFDEEPIVIIRTKDLLYQLSVNSTFHPRKKDLLVLGMDSERHLLKSSFLSKTKSVQLEAPYANYTWIAGPWDFNFGMRFDHNSEFGQQASPSAGIVYHLPYIPETSLRMGVSRAFNAPPLLWRHYDLILSGLTNNPDIKPERAYVYELGLESKPIPKLWAKLSLYRADVSDAISVATDDGINFFMKNFQKFMRQGAELQTRINVIRNLSLLGTAAFNDIVDRATNQVVRGGGKPRQSFSVGIDYKNKNGLGVYLHGYYDRWNEPLAQEPNDRKMLLDAHLSQQFKKITLFLDVHNVANSKYWADFFLPVPERYFEGGATLTW